MNLSDIELRLENTLRQAAGLIPDEQIAQMLALNRAGEPGVALENFCTQLEEYDATVPRNVAIELDALATAMGLAVTRWILERM